MAWLRHRLRRLAYDVLRDLGFVPTQRDGRRKGWICEVCKRCGRRNVIGFLVDDDVWMKVVGDSGRVWCATCFDEEAQRKGVRYEFRDLAPVPWYVSCDCYTGNADPAHVVRCAGGPRD